MNTTRTCELCCLPEKMAIASNSSLPWKILLNACFLFFLVLYVKSSLSSSDAVTVLHHSSDLQQPTAEGGCSRIHNYSDCNSKCFYVKTQMGCRGSGYLPYLRLYYCDLGRFPALGLLALLLWLLVLFYLLGNTAANYFCFSLEMLSKVLNLSPTIAGVTLLSLGNGAPDFFSSIVSFTKSGDGDVGLSSVLGGTFFVSSTVVGVISILASSNQITIDKVSFVRDVLFFLFSLLILLVVLIVGKISFLGSICFVSLYVIYVCLVSTKIFSRRRENAEADVEKRMPFLEYVDNEKPIFMEERCNQENAWFAHFEKFRISSSRTCDLLGKVVFVLELPLDLPRRLTIPVVDERRWSKPWAVTSSTLAPVFTVAVCTTQLENVDSKILHVAYVAAGLLGIVLANLTFLTTTTHSPPTKFIFPWLVGGFVMSITWTYVVAEELVSLLVSLGYILGIKPSVLGLTVLAWGNSLGDLIANVAMAVNGGADGAQIAISGCYAGPTFNILMGLGVSFVFSSWSVYPSPYVIPTDPSLYLTIGFLIGGLLWGLVILPKKKMKLDKFLGCGLLAIYFCFLFLRISLNLSYFKI